MPDVKVGDINMYYEMLGSGESLVMICDTGSSLDSLRGTASHYTEDYKVVLFDNRGAGKSDKPDVPCTIDMMADDMAGMMSGIGIESAHIFGQSMGGMIAQSFAIRYPDRVRKLVLMCTTCGNRHGAPMAESRRYNPEEREKMTPEELGEETLNLSVTRDYINKFPDIAQILKRGMMHQAEPAYAVLRQAEAARNHDTYDRLPEIKAPTMIVHGEADSTVPVENARILASRIPGSELVIFGNAGHILLEAGNEPNHAILDFLKR